MIYDLSGFGGGGGGGGGALAPLPNTFWVQADSTGTGGTAVTSGTVSAFASFTDAVAAIAGAQARFLVCQGSYGSTPVDPSGTAIEFSAEGIGGAIFNNQASLPPLLVAGNQSGWFRNVQLYPDEAGGNFCTSGYQSIIAYEVDFAGNVQVVNGLNATGCSFAGSVTGDASGGATFYGCDTQIGGLEFSTAGARCDLGTLLNFGARGVVRTDGANDATWNLAGPTGAGFQQLYAAIQDADRTVNAAAWLIQGAWVSSDSLTANRVLTVDMTHAPTLALFHVYNFSNFAGNTFTVNGTLVAPSRHATFQNVGGVLTLVSIEALN